MSENFTVERLGRAMAWSGNHGPMVDYWLAFGDGHTEHWGYTTRKQDSPAPEVGETIYGHIEQGVTKAGKPKLKLVKDQLPEGASSTPTGSSGGVAAPSPARSSASSGRNSAGHPPPHDERRDRIERQHAQEMAIRVVGPVPREPIGKDTLTVYRGELAAWTDHFCADVDAYAKASVPEIREEVKTSAGNGGAGATAQSPAPPSLISNAEAQRLLGISSNFDEAQVRLRLVACGCHDTANIAKAIEHLNAEQAKRFELGLEQIAAQEAQAIQSEGVQTKTTEIIADNEEIPF